MATASLPAGSAPGATIELLRNDQVHAKTVADNSGLFAFTPPPLPSGSHKIVLQSIAPDGKRQRSKELVTVEINGTTRPLVAQQYVNERDHPGTTAANCQSMMNGMVFASLMRPSDRTTGSWAAAFFSASRVRRTSSLLRRARRAFSFSV